MEHPTRCKSGIVAKGPPAGAQRRGGFAERGPLSEQIDADFIKRVYRTSLIALVLVAVMVYGHWGGTAAIGLTIGTAIALGSLGTLEWAVRRIVVPGASPGAAARVMVLGLLKMVLIAALLAGVIVTAQRLQASLLALVLGITGGLVLVHLVILLKAVGLWLLGQGTMGEVRRQTPGERFDEASAAERSSVGLKSDV